MLSVEQIAFKNWISAMRSRFNHGRNRDRNLTVELSIAEWLHLRAQVCFYCRANSPSGIDRKDPNKGYMLENCVPSCKSCNSRKVHFEDRGVEYAMQKTQELAYRNK